MPKGCTKTEEQRHEWFLQHKAGLCQSAERYAAHLSNGGEMTARDRQHLGQLLAFFAEFMTEMVDWDDHLENMWQRERA